MGSVKFGYRGMFWTKTKKKKNRSSKMGAKSVGKNSGGGGVGLKKSTSITNSFFPGLKGRERRA